MIDNNRTLSEIPATCRRRGDDARLCRAPGYRIATLFKILLISMTYPACPNNSRNSTYPAEQGMDKEWTQGTTDGRKNKEEDCINPCIYLRPLPSYCCNPNRHDRIHMLRIICMHKRNIKTSTDSKDRYDATLKDENYRAAAAAAAAAADTNTTRPRPPRARACVVLIPPPPGRLL